MLSGLPVEGAVCPCVEEMAVEKAARLRGPSSCNAFTIDT